MKPNVKTVVKLYSLSSIHVSQPIKDSYVIISKIESKTYSKITSFASLEPGRWYLYNASIIAEDAYESITIKSATPTNFRFLFAPSSSEDIKSNTIDYTLTSISEFKTHEFKFEFEFSLLVLFTFTENKYVFFKPEVLKRGKFILSPDNSEKANLQTITFNKKRELVSNL